jgi:hypothetical protein
MTGASNSKRDFFISFTSADRHWARWLARVLGEEGHGFWFQDQDFHGSIPRSIGEAHANSNRTIVVLSETYTKSGYCRSEWEMRYQEDPGSAKDLLILFCVSPCTPDPVLARIGYVDLFACDEAAARDHVLNRLRQAVNPDYKIPLGEAVFPGRALVNAPFPVPSHNLSLPNLDFVGREDVLAAIREALTKGTAGVLARAYALTGLVGSARRRRRWPTATATSPTTA